MDNVGNVFAAQPGYGVVSVDKQGQVFDVPGTEQIALPNGLVFDQEIPGLPLP